MKLTFNDRLDSKAEITTSVPKLKSSKVGLTGPLEASERPPERLRGPFGYIGACFEP